MTAARAVAVAAVCLACVLRPAGAAECAFKDDEIESLVHYFFRGNQIDSHDDAWMWRGFKCSELRCDPNTGTLWLNEKNKEVGFKFQMRNTKGHERLDRSVCLALKPDGEWARYSRARYRERHESAFWKERHFSYWSQTWLNGTFTGEVVPGLRNPDADAWTGYGRGVYEGCLEKCGTCDELAAAHPADPGEFETFYDSAFKQVDGYVRDRGGNERRPEWKDDDAADVDRYYPSECFSSGDFWEEWGYVTYRCWIWFVILVPLFCSGYVVACCQSHRCCPWFTTLNRLRYTAADSFPKAYAWFKYCCVDCCVGCVRCCDDAGCGCCCAATKSKKKNGEAAPRKPSRFAKLFKGGKKVAPVAITDQPGGACCEEGKEEGVANDAAAASATEAPRVRPRTAWGQLKLLMWKASKEKARDKSAIMKQLLIPSVWFILIWLLYVMCALTGAYPQAKWSPGNRNWARKSGKLHDYVRGAILSHGTLETYLAQFAFLFLMQVVIVNLVAEKSGRLLEAMKMAGLKEAVYWAAIFLVEGVICGFFVALLITTVAGPGLFRRAGHAASPPGTLLALHWMYVVALVVQCMWATTFITNNEAASIFAIAAQLCGVILYFVGGVRGGKSVSVWELDPATQRLYAFLPQMAYGLIIDGFAAHRVRKCTLRAALGGLAWDRSCDFGDDCYESAEFTCSYGDDVVMEWDDSKRKYKTELAEWAVARGSSHHFCNGDRPWDAYSYSYTAEDVADAMVDEPDIGCWIDVRSEFPDFYDDAPEPLKGQRPSAAWSGPLWGMLLLDVAVYGILAWYFNQIIPWGEFGTPKPMYFFLVPSFWCGGGAESAPAAVDDGLEPEDAADTADYEPLGPGETVRVEVRRLRKTFGAHRAVDGISFGIRDSEIFCLLGHNGAGKTTTMAMISGLLPPDPPRRKTDGATVFGHSIFDAGGMDSLRCLLGVCPQHNVLFPRLTLGEHIFFFSRLKGQTVANAVKEAASLLNVFHLGDRSHHLGAELSGGQKRKLSTSIALAGGSRFIILDEPTAGMDPVARRELWTLLRSVRIGRSLLLTTHHMDEAEALGDRVAIMAAGKVRTCGTVPFLKRRFGKGYLLSTTLAEKLADTEIGGFIKEHVATATLEEEAIVGAECTANPLLGEEVTERTYALPADEEARLAGLFDAIDDRQTELAIQSTALVPTTLETVFMAVGEDAETHNVLANEAVDASIYRDASGSAMTNAGDNAAPALDVGGSKLLGQILAIARLRLSHALNDAIVLAMPLRVVEALVCLTLEKFLGRDVPRPVTKLLGAHPGGMRCTALVVLPAFITMLLAALCADGTLATGSAHRFSILPNVIVASVVGAVYIFVPGLMAEPLVTERVLRTRNLLTISGLDYRAYWLGTWAADTALLWVAVAFCFFGLWFWKMSYQMWYPRDIIDEPMDWFDIVKAVYNATADTDPGFVDAADDTLTIWNYYCGDIVPIAECYRIKLRRRPWMDRTPWLWAIYPVFAWALAAFSHVGSNAFETSTMCLGGFPILALMVVVMPLFVTITLWLVFGGVMAGTSAVKVFNWNFGELISVFAWLASFASPIGALIMALLRVGLRPFFMFLGMVEKAEQILLTENDPLWPTMWATLLILILQAVIYEAVAYLKDRMATRPLAFVPSRFSAKRKAKLDVECTKERNRIIDLRVDAKPAADDDAAPKKGAGAKVAKVFRKLAAEWAEFRAMVQNRPPAAQYPPALRDGAAPRDVAGLNVFELRKIYPPKREGALAVEAVQNVTFGVPIGQVFGLLGANGAGKTTTMSMVMRAVEPTSGDAKIGGASVLTDFARASSHLGVVNQHNSLWSSLSCFDHCCLFARLRRVGSETAVRRLARETLQRVELHGHADKMAGRLSGGMKRKLCCAAALVGDPRIVLLDEPSAGLDPVSQRNLWNLVKATMAGRAVVLTTHSMVEADVLCDRIGIMVKGQLECLGTPRYLKDTYASGYELAIKLDDTACATPATWASAIERVTAFAGEKFAPDHSVSLAAADASLLTYEVNGESVRGLLAKAFRTFDAAAKRDLGIAEFSVSQASMEKVFIRIVAKTASTNAGARSIYEQNEMGREVAAMLQEEEDDDELLAELKAMKFKERKCCCLTRFAHMMQAKYNCFCCCFCCCWWWWSILQCPCCIFFHWTSCWACMLHFLSIFVNCAGACCLPAPPADD